MPLLFIGFSVCILWPLLAKAQISQGLEPKSLFNSPEHLVALTATSPLGEEEPPVAKPKPKTVEQLVREAFPDAPIMVRIARAESQFNPKARNPYSTAVGVFQILKGTWADYGCTGERTNSVDNIRCARKIYDEAGTTPWLDSQDMW